MPARKRSPDSPRRVGDGSPRAGIGNEGYMALKLGRRFYGCEIKAEYIAQAKKNLAAAERAAREATRTLFDTEESPC